MVLFWLYEFAMQCFGAFLSFLAPFNASIRNWRYTQKKQFAYIQSPAFNTHQKPVVWMHCSSLGEFEQGRKVLSTLRKSQPHNFYVLSFFSPSGFLNINNKDVADYIFYLPFDRASDMSTLVKCLHPAIFILVKNELWWNLLKQLSTHNCQKYLIAFSLQESKYYLHPLFHPFKNILQGFTHIFATTRLTSEILSQHKIINSSHVGDPRIDTVIAKKGAMSVKKFDLNKPLIVYGSIYVGDLERLIHDICRLDEYIHVIVPHDVSESNVEDLAAVLSLHNLSYEYLHQSTDFYAAKVLIVNKIGHLFDLYSMASMAYIGGAFDKGHHNCLEPAVFNLPIAIYQGRKMSSEIKDLLEAGVITLLDEKFSFYDFLQISMQPAGRIKAVEACDKYLEQGRGASAKIVAYIVSSDSMKSK